MDGWIDVWIENTKGEQPTKSSAGGKAELVIPKRGHYVLRINDDHAKASVNLSIYTAE